MRYKIDSISEDETIMKYFERENDILVRYINGRTEIVDYSSRDLLDDLMREQAHEFTNQKGEVRKQVIGDNILTTAGLAYIFTFTELIIKSVFGNSQPFYAILGFIMWILGENLYSYMFYDRDLVHGKAKYELEMIKKYQLFLKNEERILEYLENNPSEFSGKINDLDFVNYKSVKEMVRLSKRKK